MVSEVVSFENGKLFSQEFNQAFKTLSGLKQLGSKEKMALVKLRHQFIAQGEAVRETEQNLSDETPEDKVTKMNELLETECSYQFNRLDVKLVASQLSADELFHLEPLLKGV